MGALLSQSLETSDDKLEAFTLIWLDANIHDSDNAQLQRKLRDAVRQFKAFDNSRDCEEYIREKDQKDQIILIVSGQLGKDVVPRLHSLESLVSIYIFCGNQDWNEKWAAQHNKVMKKQHVHVIQ